MRLPAPIVLAVIMCVHVGASPVWAAPGTHTVPCALSASVPAPAVHNVHVTHAQIGVDGEFVAARIKYFKHDLEDAIAKLLKRPTVKLGTDAASDSLFLMYLDAHFILKSGGAQLHGRVVGSGEETETEMWWYEVLYEADEPISDLAIENKQLLELFKDQKNIVKAEHLASGKRQSFYFARRATTGHFVWE